MSDDDKCGVFLGSEQSSLRGERRRAARLLKAFPVSQKAPRERRGRAVPVYGCKRGAGGCDTPNTPSAPGGTLPSGTPFPGAALVPPFPAAGQGEGVAAAFPAPLQTTPGNLGRVPRSL